MLINCPRCGFQQPVDKYCAQCGVDIETFRPAPEPFLKTFFGSVTVQISLLVIAAVGVSIFIYGRGQQNLQERVSYLKSGIQIQAAALAENPPQNAQTESFTETEEAGEAASLAEQASQTPGEGGNPGDSNERGLSGQAPLPLPAGTAAGDLQKLAKKPAAGAHLIVSYAEVDRNVLANLVSASRGTGQFMSFNDYSAGILPRMKSVMGSSIKILHKEDRVLAADAKSLQWFLGLSDPRDPTRQIGFNTYFEINDADTNVLRGNIEVLRIWREEAPGGTFELQRKTFPAIFEIGEDNGFFMYGIMPRQSHLQDETELQKIDLYKILNSSAFRANESDFVIFVEYDKNN